MTPPWLIRAKLLPDLGLFAASARRRMQARPGPSFAAELRPRLGDLMDRCTHLASLPDAPPAWNTHAREAMAACGALLKQVDMLLELERLADGRLLLDEREADASELAEMALREAQAHLPSAAFMLTLDVPADAVEIRCDMGRLQFILLTLVERALATRAQPGDVRLVIELAAHGLFFRVEGGNPAGLPAAIDLTLACALAELHGGSIRVEPGAAALILPHWRVLPRK